MYENTSNDQARQPERQTSTRDVDADFRITTEKLKPLGEIGTLRRAPSPPETQIDGTKSWVRYHLLEYHNQTLTLWTTDNVCTIYARCDVQGRDNTSWSAIVNSDQFNALMQCIGGVEYDVVHESSFLLLKERRRNLRIPLHNSIGDFKKPIDLQEAEYHQVSRVDLIRALAFLTGAAPNPSTPDPSDVDKTQTVSLYEDGVAMANEDGIDRLAKIPSLPFDIHLARVYVRRLAKWLKMIDGDVSVAKLDEGNGRQLFCFRDNTDRYRMWLPARRDGRLRTKVENARGPSRLLTVQIERRPFLESVKFLSTTGRRSQFTIHFSGGSNGTVRILLEAVNLNRDNSPEALGSDEHVGTLCHQSPDMGSELVLSIEGGRLQQELNRLRGRSLLIVCRKPPGGLSLLATEDGQHPRMDDEAIHELLNDHHFESVFPARVPETCEEVDRLRKNDTSAG